MVDLLHSPVERPQTVQDGIWHGLRGTVGLADERGDTSGPDGLAKARMTDHQTHWSSRRGSRRPGGRVEGPGRRGDEGSEDLARLAQMAEAIDGQVHSPRQLGIIRVHDEDDSRNRKFRSGVQGREKKTED
jgi:hypothetical protein